MIKKWARGVGVLLAGTFTQLAFAGVGGGVVITYAPAGTSSVPTMSEWTLLALAAMVALVAYRFLRQRLHGQPLAAVFLTVVVGTLAFLGGHFGNQALALPPTDLSMSLSGGGTVTLTCQNSGNVVNNTGVPLKIVSVTGGVNLGGTCITLPTVQPLALCTVTNFCT